MAGRGGDALCDGGRRGSRSPIYAGRSGDSGQRIVARLEEPSEQAAITPHDIRVLRQALDRWGVTMVVVPDQPGLPAYDQVGPVSSIAAVMTAAVGKRPMFQGSAWVWTEVDRAPPPTIPTSARLSECTAGMRSHGIAAVDAAHRVRSGRRVLSGPCRRRRSMSGEIHTGHPYGRETTGGLGSR